MGRYVRIFAIFAIVATAGCCGAERKLWIEQSAQSAMIAREYREMLVEGMVPPVLAVELEALEEERRERAREIGIRVRVGSADDVIRFAEEAAATGGAQP